jgi:predicted GNAT superfamily acetyltransferase
LEHGLTVITWTFDPLIRRNAYFNLTKLGAEAAGYHVNFYGEMGDRLNRGDESDRCEVTWDLTSDRALAASTGSGPDLDLSSLLAAGAVPVLEDGDGRQPVSRPLRGAVRLCWIPADALALRATAPQVARSWRLALRDTLGASIADGFFASGMTRSGWYVLERR